MYTTRPSDPDANYRNISLGSSGMRRKQNYDIVFGFTSNTAVLTFTFSFLSSPLFSLFLASFFFFCWAFRRLHFGGKSFRSMLQDFLHFSPLSLTELCSFWYGLKDLFTLHKLVDIIVLDC